MIKKQKKNKVKIPGKQLLRHIQYGFPEDNGTYIVYTKPFVGEPALSSTFPTAFIDLINIKDNRPSRKLNILAYIGPIPHITLDEIEVEYKNEDLIIHVYCIGTIKDAVKFSWKQGPYTNVVQAMCEDGEDGDFIFEINQRTTLPKPIYKYSEKHFKFINIKNPNAITQKLKKLKKQAKNPTHIEKLKVGDYVIATIQGVQTCKYIKRSKDLIEIFGTTHKDKPVVYIFEQRENGLFPIHVWKKGWAGVSNKKVRAIRKRIGEL